MQESLLNVKDFTVEYKSGNKVVQAVNHVSFVLIRARRWAVVEAGEKRSGVTVHFVSAEVDGGDIILQKSVELVPGETAESLEAKIHPLEYEIYPEAIARVARSL